MTTPTSQEPTDDSVISEDLAITRLAQTYLDPQSTAARIRRSAGQRSDRAQQLIDEANQNPDLAARLLQDPLGVLQRAGALACGDAITLELGLPEVVAAGGYPSTRALSAWHSIASLLVLKLLRRTRVSHATELAADTALGLAVGLTVPPEATHASSYSYRVRRQGRRASKGYRITALA